MKPALLTLLFLLPLTPAAAEPETAARIDAAVHAALEPHLRALGGEASLELGLDPVRLPARCPQPLTAALAVGNKPVGNTSVQVRCSAARTTWSLYVPVRVQVMADALVAARPLTRGAPLTGEDIARKRVDLAGLGAGVLTDPAQALGKKLRYPVAAGTVLSSGVLENQPLVRRGQTVVVVSGTPGFEVRATGEALADGHNGDRILIRNRQSRKVIEGRVEAAGVVRVAL